MLSQEPRIKNLSLEFVGKRLQDQSDWAKEDVERALERYKNFLLLICKYPNVVLAPAPDIDEVWHQHILFTKEYARDCHAIFGEYLHHTPSQAADPREKKRMEKALSQTAALYTQEFKELYFLELDISSFW